ncbi:MAG: response regulator [Gammaproteobacteria bacterium]|nr:response regulator [Gammaproteobacteria bacterium]MDE2349820.1 response regulator [Gammaproteobacteria bacterium]
MARTILLVEDNERNSYLAKYLLEHGGFAVVVAPDGPRALALVVEAAPAAILLDIQLPGMDGYAVARALRATPVASRLPIIALTSYAMAGDREKALAAGCDGYIEKPIEPDSFVAEIEKVLATVAARR